METPEYFTTDSRHQHLHRLPDGRHKVVSTHAANPCVEVRSFARDPFIALACVACTENEFISAETQALVLMATPRAVLFSLLERHPLVTTTPYSSPA